MSATVFLESTLRFFLQLFNRSWISQSTSIWKVWKIESKSCSEIQEFWQMCPKWQFSVNLLVVYNQLWGNFEHKLTTIILTNRFICMWPDFTPSFAGQSVWHTLGNYSLLSSGFSICSHFNMSDFPSFEYRIPTYTNFYTKARITRKNYFEAFFWYSNLLDCE